MSCIYGIYRKSDGEIVQAGYASHCSIESISAPSEAHEVIELPMQDTNRYWVDVNTTPPVLREK